MSNDNPYQSPATTPLQESRANAPEVQPSSTDDRKIVRYAQLGLRLLGVMFIVNGISVFACSFTWGLMQSSALQRDGYAPTPDPYVFGLAAQAAAYATLGLYFVVGGRWVIEKVFASPSPPDT